MIVQTNTKLNSYTNRGTENNTKHESNKYKKRDSGDIPPQ